MKIGSWLKVALGVAVLTCGAGAAQAQGMGPVERSGHTYHRAVCAHNNGPGEARCHAHVVTDAAGNERSGQASPNATPSGYGPAQLQAAYGDTGPWSTNTIAIVDAYGYPNAQSDLAVYRATFGLPPCPSSTCTFRKVNQNGQTYNYPRSNIGWDQEQALDLDMASAMCPTCNILLVEASSASYANLATAVGAAHLGGAFVISNSYGGGESGSTNYAGAYAISGTAITVSTGDSGYGVQFPASAPGTIAVGGTHLVLTATGWTEKAWSGGGSGCSTIYDKPSWQSLASTGCAKRMEADISAVADPATGVAVYGPNSSGRPAWLVFGGTSVAAPLVGGIYAASNIKLDASTIQPRAASNIWITGLSGKNDVLSGSNGSCGSSQCTAGQGYDGPTGWGTPNGNSGL
jgi:subtilase family serine protease